MRYVLLIMTLMFIGCEGEKSSSDEASKEPGLTLADLYANFTSYQSLCSGDDHNCTDENYIHYIDDFALCEAISNWEYGSGERWIIPAHRYHNTSAQYDFIVLEDNNPDFNFPEGAVAGRDGTQYPGTWYPYGIIGSFYLEFGPDCHIEFENVWNGSNNIPTIKNAKYKGVKFMEDGLFMYSP